MKGSYQGDNDQFHRLQTRANSGVSEVEDKVQQFPLEKLLMFQIWSRPCSLIVALHSKKFYSQQIAELFATLPDPSIDGVVKGLVLGYSPPFFYQSCSDCSRKVPEGITSCPGCNKKRDDITLCLDFNTVLQVENIEVKLK